MAKDENEDYLLGVNNYELERLRLQHEVWKSITNSFFDRTDLSEGMKVMDVGSGPGFVSLDLLKRIGTAGELTALEPSEFFLNYFKDHCRRNNINNVKFLKGTAETAKLPAGHFDLIFFRWVIGFVPDPELFISNLIKSLARGGIIAIQDYAFQGLDLYPRGGAYEKLSPAVETYWKLTGGDLRIAPRIPPIFRKLGIELVEFKPNCIAGSPGSGIFEWHHSFITHHVPLMAENNIISKSAGEEILNDWNEHKNNPESVFFSPIVVDIAGKL